jgi:predicted  nucleic acid-binding Zn-ribbon protein
VSRFDGLLEVQALDTAIDQLRHKRTALPERGELKALETDAQALAAELKAAVAARDEVAAKEAAFEKDMATSEARIAEIDKRMYSGEVSSSKDLQAMATEIEHLKARVSGLEDSALEALDEREPLDAAVAELEARAAGMVELGQRLTAAIAAAEAEIDGELAREVEQRASAAAGVPDDLLAEYERLRGRLGGIGVAKLEHGTCLGCRMKLPATELDRVKHQPPDALVHCEQCGRILVRAEHGA